MKAGDIVLCYLCMALAYVAAHHVGTGGVYSLLVLPRPAIIFAGMAGLGFAWHLSFERAGLYHSHRMTSLTEELRDVLQACALAIVATLAILLLAHIGIGGYVRLSLHMTFFFGVLLIPVLLLSRTLSRFTVQHLREKGHNLRQVLILGSNRRATDFAERLRSNASWGYNVVGFVDDHWWDTTCGSGEDQHLLGRLKDLPELLRRVPVDEIVLALPIASYYEEVASTISLCKQHGILVRVAGTFFDGVATNHHLREQGPAQTLTLHDRSWDPWGTLVKRLFDVAVSGTLLLLLSPVLAIVALLIRFSSPGPVLFKQTRLGRGKQPFSIFKFRTMVTNAEQIMKSVEHLNETSGPTFKLKNDPRITRVGAFLRKTSLDELPQFLNVLRGDMSLVGPRPLPLRDYEGFSEDWHRRRFSVKPGITCLWQIMGRSSITFDQWMALDMRYIDQWSLWLDVKILAKTIPAVLRGSGAV